MFDKQRIGIITGITLLLIIMLFPTANALTITLAQPSNSEAISDNVGGQYFREVEVTIDQEANITQLEVLASSPSTGNSTAKRIGINASGVPTTNSTNITVKINTSIFEDATDYTILVNATNSTSGTEAGMPESDTSTSVTIDNTAPATPTSLLPAEFRPSDADNDFLISAAVGASTTTSCTLIINKGRIAMTHGGDTCNATLTIPSSVPEGAYNYQVEASDGTNITNANGNIIIRLKGSSAAPAVFALQQQAAQDEQQISSNGILLLLGAIALIWLASKGGRR